MAPVACADCMKNCVRIHQLNNEESAIKLTRFFKVVFGRDYDILMYVPPDLALTMEHLAGQEFLFEDAEGRRWPVLLSHVNGLLAFTNGWVPFFSHHNLEECSFLVFEYVEGSKFLFVRVFAKNGLETVNIDREIFNDDIIHQRDECNLERVSPNEEAPDIQENLNDKSIPDDNLVPKSVLSEVDIEMISPNMVNMEIHNLGFRTCNKAFHSNPESTDTEMLDADTVDSDIVNDVLELEKACGSKTTLHSDIEITEQNKTKGGEPMESFDENFENNSNSNEPALNIEITYQNKIKDNKPVENIKNLEIDSGPNAHACNSKITGQNKTKDGEPLEDVNNLVKASDSIQSYANIEVTEQANKSMGGTPKENVKNPNKASGFRVSESNIGASKSTLRAINIGIRRPTKAKDGEHMEDIEVFQKASESKVSICNIGITGLAKSKVDVTNMIKAENASGFKVPAASTMPDHSPKLKNCVQGASSAKTKCSDLAEEAKKFIGGNLDRRYKRNRSSIERPVSKRGHVKMLSPAIDVKHDSPNDDVNQSIGLCPLSVVVKSEKYLTLPVAIPSTLSRKIFYQGEGRRVIFLRDKNGKLWPVVYSEKQFTQHITAYWELFCKGNNVRIGDECRFEVENVKSRVYRVSVARHSG